MVRSFSVQRVTLCRMRFWGKEKCFHLCERLTRAETLDEDDFLRRLNDDDDEENTSARFDV